MAGSVDLGAAAARAAAAAMTTTGQTAGAAADVPARGRRSPTSSRSCARAANSFASSWVVAAAVAARRAGGYGGPQLNRSTFAIGAAAAVALWGSLASFYTVKPEEQSVELLLWQVLRHWRAGPEFSRPGRSFRPM